MEAPVRLNTSERSERTIPLGRYARLRARPRVQPYTSLIGVCVRYVRNGGSAISCVRRSRVTPPMAPSLVIGRDDLHTPLKPRALVLGC